MGWARLDQDWIKPPVGSAKENPPKNSAASVTTLNPVAPSFPPPQREEWGKLIGLAEDCTLCKQGSCGYVKPRPRIPKSIRQHGYRPGITTPGDSSVVGYVP